jgi:hypothetical protein
LISEPEIDVVVHLLRDDKGFFVLCDGTDGDGVPVASASVRFKIGQFLAEKDHEPNSGC